MKLKLLSIIVDDQNEALKFYTEVLDFVKKTEFPVAEYKWLTVVSPEGVEDIELVLEPNANPVAKTFQEAIYAQGVPLTAFAVNEIASEHDRLKQRGVKFTMPPTPMGPVTIAVFVDTCGNLIQIYEV